MADQQTTQYSVAILNDATDPEGNGIYSGRAAAMTVALDRTTAERSIAAQYAAGRGAAQWEDRGGDGLPEGAAERLAAVGDHERFAELIATGSGGDEAYAYSNVVAGAAA